MIKLVGTFFNMNAWWKTQKAERKHVDLVVNRTEKWDFKIMVNTTLDRLCRKQNGHNKGTLVKGDMLADKLSNSDGRNKAWLVVKAMI